MKKILSLYASKNKGASRDASGAFIPQAKVFRQTREAAGDLVISVPFDNGSMFPGARRKAFLGAIDAGRSLLRSLHQAERFDAIAYFGHGLRTGMPSAGFGTLSLGPLVQALHAALEQEARVVLYACSMAEAPAAGKGIDGDGGYADLIRDQLSVLGHTGWVDGHTIAGHATINRYTRRFYMDGRAPATGGTWLVAPGSPEWREWGNDLKHEHTFRFGFPFMSETEIHAHLRAA